MVAKKSKRKIASKTSTAAKATKRSPRTPAPAVKAKPTMTLALFRREVRRREREQAEADAQAETLSRATAGPIRYGRSLPPVETNVPKAPKPAASDRFVRIAFAPRDPENDSPMLLDCRLSSSGRIVGEWPIFGLWGSSHTPDDLAPFLLDASGALDFGSVDEPENEVWRWCPTNLRSKDLVVDNLVTVRRADDDRHQRDCIYRVASVSVLGGVAPVET